MKKTIKKYISNGVLALTGMSMIFSSCKESFLEADPLSFYEPTTTFSTESGIQSVLAIADRQLKRYWSTGDHNEMLPLITEYIFSDLMVAAATDKTQMLDNVAQMLTPNSDQSTLNNLDRTNSIWFFWQQTYEGIRNANTILTYIDGVEGLDERQREWGRQVMRRTRFSLASRLLVSAAFSGGYLLVFLWGTVQLGEGLITFGTMAAFLQLVGKIQQPE